MLGTSLAYVGVVFDKVVGDGVIGVVISLEIWFP